MIDYGHLKSLLIESAYPQKDEHAIAINTLAALLHKVEGKELTEAEKADLDGANPDAISKSSNAQYVLSVKQNGKVYTGNADKNYYSDVAVEVSVSILLTNKIQTFIIDRFYGNL